MTGRGATDGALAGASHQFHRVPLGVIDGVLGALIVAIGVLTTGSASINGVAVKPRDGLAWVLIAAATLPYFARRRAPVTVFAVTGTAVVVMMLIGYDEGALPGVTVVGLYTVGSLSSSRAVAVAAVLAAGMLAVLALSDAPRFGTPELITAASAYSAALLVGRTMQQRRRRIDGFAEVQAEAARRAEADERLRIAQELHDIVAHSLGLITVQATAGSAIIDTDPGEAKRSLDDIAQVSRSSLAEIRRLVGALRGSDAYAPIPSLADLPRLASEVSSAGLGVDLEVEGEIDDVPSGVGLAGYRVVQEALTNAIRHGHGSHASVRVEATDGVLRIEVVDDGVGASGTTGLGHGLIGMRERVGVYGGTLTAGSPPEGGFRVAASMSYEAGTA